MKYRVHIVAKIGKTITVDAANEFEAELIAHDKFDVTVDRDGHYNQEIIHIYEEDAA
jgi:hypothetical protein